MTPFDVEKLPPIPQVLLKLIEKCHQVDVSFNELTDIIQMDAALTAKVISVASSPAYTQLNETKDFKRLLAELGLGTIRTIATTSAVHLFFSRHDERADRILRQCWRNSLTTAHIARSLAQLTGCLPEDDAYAAGLLHNIGQLLLLKKSPDDYLKVVSDTCIDTAVEEQRRFGITSVEAGAKLIGEWQLDSFLEDAVRYQQETTQSILDASCLVKLINFACKLSERREPLEQLVNDGKLLFGLNRPQLDELLSQIDGEIQQRGEQQGIALEAITSKSETEARVHNEQVHLELACQVRNIGLLDSVCQHLNTGCDLEDTLRVVCQDLNILFGLPRSICFLYSAESNQLTAAEGNNGKQNEFLIPVEQGRSLLADTILQKQLNFSLVSATQESLTVADQQLIKLLDGEGILCIPLITKQQVIGVLVASITKQSIPKLKHQQRLISYFANEAARVIQHWQQLLIEQQQLLAIEHARLLEHTGKLLHEAYNPLSIINNYLQLLAGKLGEEHAAQSELAILTEEVERVAGILMRMKDLPQADDIPQGEVDLNVLIQDLLSIFRTSLFASHSIQETVSLDSAMPPVLGNRNSLKQVITNLVKNAVEAMPDGGAIRLATRGQVNVDGELFVELTISDTGQGMTNDTMNNLFKPMDSTKGKGNAGLGLSIVKKLISDMRGTICCKSEMSGGTEFQILLPMKKKDQI